MLYLLKNQFYLYFSVLLYWYFGNIIAALQHWNRWLYGLIKRTDQLGIILNHIIYTSRVHILGDMLAIVCPRLYLVGLNQYFALKN